MRYGLSLPNFGDFSDIDLVVALAGEAEDAGWDAFFLWDHLIVFQQNPPPFTDPWIALSAIACNTSKIKLGPLVTPLPRRRPWKVAREAVALDHLSKGRLIFGAGLGAPPEMEFAAFDEESSAKIRAEKLEEGLQIIQGLWTGESFSFSGKHYKLVEMTFLPKPYQAKIPIWIGGGVPHKAPFRRAAKFDGVAPVHSQWPQPVQPTHLEVVLDIIREERGSLDDYDVVICGETSGSNSEKDNEIILAWKDAGITWWIEDINSMRDYTNSLRERIKAGPPAE